MNSFQSILFSPITGGLHSDNFLCLPELSGLIVEGVVRIGGGEKSLDGEKDSTDLQGRTPLILQNVETDTAKTVNVGMVDAG